jgi:L-fuconolactonase
MIIVDCHPHIYAANRITYPTIPEPVEHVEPASAEDLKRRMEASGVDKAVFIQTSTFYEFDNRYIIDATARHGSWATGVVTLSPDNPDDIAELRRAHAAGVRGMRGNPDESGSITSPGIKRLWGACRDLGMVVNCHVSNDRPVMEILEIAAALPGLTIVLDHCLYLSAKLGNVESTIAKLEVLARASDQFYAKLTCAHGGSDEPWPHRDMHEPLQRVVAAFGAERCVWGSDFPQALWTPGTSYDQHVRLFTEELGLSEEEKVAIMGTTALKLWFGGGGGKL